MGGGCSDCFLECWSSQQGLVNPIVGQSSKSGKKIVPTNLIILKYFMSPFNRLPSSSVISISRICCLLAMPIKSRLATLTRGNQNLWYGEASKQTKAWSRSHWLSIVRSRAFGSSQPSKYTMNTISTGRLLKPTEPTWSKMTGWRLPPWPRSKI